MPKKNILSDYFRLQGRKGGKKLLSKRGAGYFCRLSKRGVAARREKAGVDKSV